MLFRITYETDVKPAGILDVFKAADASATYAHVGSILVNYGVEITLPSVNAAKAVMREVYRKTRQVPRCYAYTCRSSFMLDPTGNTPGIYFPDRELWDADREWMLPHDTERFMNFLGKEDK